MSAPRSIGTRFMSALMLMTLLTLAIASGLSALMDLKLFREHMLRDLRVLAEVIGENCVSALVFDSPESAERNLETLAPEYQVRAATLYDAEGRPFARFDRGAKARSAASGVQIEHPLSYDGSLIGRLVLEVQLDELARQARQYAWLAAAVVLSTLALALAMATYLQRRITRPLLDLVGAVRAVAQRQDFSQRVHAPRAEREIAILVQDFNHMLEQIEQREAALHGANATLRRLATDLSLLEETEKARLAAELHDGPMQKLALAQMQIDAGTEAADEESRAEAEQQLDTGLTLMREAIGELRTLQFELSPPVLHQRGLAAALEWLARNTRERWGIALAFSRDADLPRLDRQQSVILFLCARELVLNLIKHSGARGGSIELAAADDGLELTVADDGQGFDASDGDVARTRSDGGYGLYSVRERLQLLGGNLDIRTSAAGTRCRIWLPPAEPQNGVGRPVQGRIPVSGRGGDD